MAHLFEIISGSSATSSLNAGISDQFSAAGKKKTTLVIHIIGLLHRKKKKYI